MKILFYIFVIIYLIRGSKSAETRMICYYDTIAATRIGDAKFTPSHMEEALKFCTHMIYGYAGITPGTFAVKPLSQQQEQEFSQVLRFKQKHPHVKYLMSIGGDRDNKSPMKYIELLEAPYQKQQTFVMTILEMLKKYNFDGLDLAYQFPKTKPKKLSVEVWKTLKRQFSGEDGVTLKSKEHKKQFSALINLLKATFKFNKFMLTLTVLPNIDSETYFDAPLIMKHLDFVTLAGFDFYTPERNPDAADFTAPIRGPPVKGNRIPTSNIDSQVNLWLGQRVHRNKINVGVATWGRSWKLTSKSPITGEPVVTNTNGPAPGGTQTKTPGLLSWPEICIQLRTKGQGKASLRRVNDISRSYGNYAFRVPDKNNKDGIWISYEEPQTASYKAAMVRKRQLGGVALFDLGMDDISGVCNADKFPILRAMKYELLGIKSKL